MHSFFLFNIKIVGNETKFLFIDTIMLESEQSQNYFCSDKYFRIEDIKNHDC